MTRRGDRALLTGTRRALRLALALAPFAAPALAAAPPEITYKTELQLQGLDNSRISDALKSASQLIALQDKPPPSNGALRRRADDDLPRLAQVMRAEGYWQAKVSYTLDTSSKPEQVTITIEPGPLFRLSEITFRTPEGGTPPLLDKLGTGAVGLDIGAPARSAPVAAAEARIVDVYARDGHPFATVTDRKVVIDVAKHTMSASFTVSSGPPARFGRLAIHGLKRVNRDFVQRRIAWKEGSPYDSRQVEATRESLVRTGLFSAVRVDHAASPDAGGEVAMTVDLVEGPPRSVGAGVSYNTNLGLGGQAFWEHRNLFGEGERLRATAGVAQRQLGLALDFRKPDFIDPNQALVANAGLLKQTTDAFNSRRAQIFLGVERPLLPSLTLVTGLDFERATVHENELGLSDENYSLVGLPVVLRRDTTDDLLDPTIGGRQNLTVTPYHAVAGPNLDFVTSRLELRHYQRLDDTGRYVLAGFAALGSIVGARRDELPADKRLYAGGAGSVRGYAFQHAGPLDAAGVPVGGASSLELGTELRYRITDTIGIVPFVEGGNVYPTSLPDNSSLFWGAGVGLRYYTLVGPLRLDLATPFTHRPGDKPIEVYISIGQAF
ncbi:MAG TPA: autotransporter assembly complex family protein [Stellaceae bacterium]|nr:autotransporter assembly complex family protein [Stellaceae bacterium]